MRSLRVAHRKNRIGGMRAGHIGNVHDAHMTQNMPMALFLLAIALSSAPSRVRNVWVSVTT